MGIFMKRNIIAVLVMALLALFTACSGSAEGGPGAGGDSAKGSEAAATGSQEGNNGTGSPSGDITGAFGAARFGFSCYGGCR